MASTFRMTLKRTLTLKSPYLRSGGNSQSTLRRTMSVKGIKSIFKDASTQLIEASWGGDVELVKTLCYGGQGYTPLHYACSNGHNEVVKILIEVGANTDIRDKDGKHILHHICYFGNRELLRYLLARGAETFTGSRGKSLLHYAAASGHYEITRLLLAYKGNPSLKDRWGSIPLHYACYYVHAPEKRWNIPKPEKFLRYIATSILGSEEGGESFRRVHYMDEREDAIEKKEQEKKQKYEDFIKIVVLLIASGSSPETMNNNGKCPFDYCGSGKKRDKLLYYICRYSDRYTAQIKAEMKRQRVDLDKQAEEERKEERAHIDAEAEKLRKADEDMMDLAEFRKLMNEKEDGDVQEGPSTAVVVDMHLTNLDSTRVSKGKGKEVPGKTNSQSDSESESESESESSISSSSGSSES